MRALMGLIKDRHGTYYAQRKVPERLQAAVARVLGTGKARQVFLKKSLGTKVVREANVRATSVLAGFDRTIASATAIIASAKSPPRLRQSLNSAEIARMAEALYGKLLADDEAVRFGGRAYMARSVEWIRRNEDPDFEPPYPIESIPEYGWTPENLALQKEHMVHELATMQEALALGDITAVVDDVSLLLADFEINLDRNSTSYRELAMQALRAYVRALQAIDKRNAGEPIETPKFTRGSQSDTIAAGTLRDAVKGWQKERQRPAGTVHEYERAVEMFIELHGDLSVAEIKKPHARKFREAVQQVPQRRVGTLRGAKLPEMSEWGEKHPSVPKISAGTVNKQLGALQAIAGWAEQNGLIPDDVAWSNPFAKMKVREEQSERTSFETTELKLLFAAPVFTKHEYPQGARGPAAFWLPLLALFTGARQAELAGLTAGNVQSDEETATPLVYITSEASRGKRLKTVSSQRVVAVHPQLVKLGFLKFVDDMRRREGANGWLFPLVAPDKGRSGVAAWSKWFGRYLRKQGVTDTAKVFHSFRHSVTDALRRGKVDHELREALVGHSLGSKVDYGAKQMLARWGAAALKDAVATISYPGLDLSRVRPFAVRKPTRGNK
jgi:integrase